MLPVIPIADSEPVSIVKPEPSVAAGQGSGSQALQPHRSARSEVRGVTLAAGCGVAACYRSVPGHGRGRGRVSSWVGPPPSRPPQAAVASVDQTNAPQRGCHTTPLTLWEVQKKKS